MCSLLVLSVFLLVKLFLLQLSPACNYSARLILRVLLGTLHSILSLSDFVFGTDR